MHAQRTHPSGVSNRRYARSADCYLKILILGQPEGGVTALWNLRLLCRFHHLIAIYRWGWTLTCHPDGTTTATGPDGRTLHSHGPPTCTA